MISASSQRMFCRSDSESKKHISMFPEMLFTYECSNAGNTDFRNQQLGLSETYYTIIISVWRETSQAFYEAVDVILSGLVLCQPFENVWGFPGQKKSNHFFSFFFPDVRSLHVLFISPNFILNRFSWQLVVPYHSINKAGRQNEERGRNIFDRRTR